MRARPSLLALLALMVLSPGCSPSWIPVESSDGGFSIEMPGEPEQQTRAVATVAGEIAMRIYSAEQGRYMVSFADYPAEIVAGSTPEKVLDGARDGAAVNIQGELLRERVFDFDGHPARDLVLLDSTEQLELHMRIVLVGPRLYQIAFLTTRGDDDDVGPRFRDSFTLIDGASLETR